MTMRRFAFPALLAAMVMAFAVPSFANDLTGATGTISCSNYTLTFSYDHLTVGSTYTTSYTFTINSTSASAITISSSTSFTATQITETTPTITVPLSLTGGTIIVTAASATGPTLTQPIIFTYSSTPLVCPPVPPPTLLGRFTGGGKEIKVGGGVTITFGFELDCDLKHPNTLEINWAGNQFHMEDFSSAVCSLNGNPAPPKAPINTMVGIGTGRFDGAKGYTVDFTLIDNGEPGTKDEAAFLIFETNNPSNVILNIPLQLLSNGNLQAHPDQH